MNADGRFDQLDLAGVLQAGKYLTNEPASWSEGDWNADGRFNHQDIVLALQGGQYYGAEPYRAADSQVVKRDLQEFLDAQGTYLEPNPLLPDTPRQFHFVNNPDINGDGVDDGQRYIMYFDWAGMLGRESSYGGQFGPESITGKVTERPLGNGMSEVTASVRTQGALIWVTTWDAGNQTSAWLRHDGPTVFGHRETELLADSSLEAARADIHYTIKFVIEEGAALQDEMELYLEDNAELSFQLVLNAKGPLTEAFGTPDGTTGRLTWGKPGLWQDGNSPANDNADNGAASLYPNDEFHLGPIGPRLK